ncbi:type I methionyl aminopeptidase [Anaerolineales bacterium HSG6]|nr:type I methionyl aminopeptidase [Anaerolineales bacterium HSG6]MDM8530911.1 type I methionyl aminopeptidase [Anaerolineales bacterium HSG25]
MFLRRNKKKNGQRKKEGIILRSKKEISLLRDANKLVAESFAALGEAIKPGVSLKELDQLTTTYIKKNGAQPLYLGYKGNPPNQPPFPGVICASLNEEVCHGIPDDRVLKEGDVIGIDIGVRLKGFCGDSCVTFPVGEVSEATKRLLRVSEEALHIGIEEALVKRRLTNIGAAIQAHAESHGYNVVEEWGGHGVGRTLHEDPSVSHTGPGNRGPRIKPGMVFTIEPMINAGVAEWDLQEDGWTVKTRDGKLSAQFEHTIAITPQGPEILSKLPTSNGRYFI